MYLILKKRNGNLLNFLSYVIKIMSGSRDVKSYFTKSINGNISLLPNFIFS